MKNAAPTPFQKEKSYIPVPPLAQPGSELVSSRQQFKFQAVKEAKRLGSRVKCLKANMAQNNVVRSARYKIRTLNGSHLKETETDEIHPSQAARTLFSAPAQKRDSDGSIQKVPNQRTSATLPTDLDEVYEASYEFLLILFQQTNDVVTAPVNSPQSTIKGKVDLVKGLL